MTPMKTLVVAALMGSALAGCGGDQDAVANRPTVKDEPKQEGKPAKLGELSDQQREVATPAWQAQSTLAKRLLGELIEAKAGENFMVSPWSLGEAFGMLRLGATGETDQQLARFLATTQTPAEAGEAARVIRSAFASLESSGTLVQANALFVRKGEALEKPFLDQTQQWYGAAPRVTMFPQPGLDEVNAFVKEKTRDRIPKLFDEISPESIAVLVNAISFKDKWQTPFEKSNTAPANFNLADGSKREVPMMNHSGKIAYGETSQVQSVTLPYASGLSMTLILPKPGVGLKSAMAGIESLDAVISMGTPRQGTIQIPKWKAEFKWDLKAWMTERGFDRPFDPVNAELRGIRKDGENLFVAQALQKTFIQVDEEGTEVAAATGIDIAPTAAPMDPEEPFSFIADRPFVYMITTNSGQPLFVGVVADPKF